MSRLSVSDIKQGEDHSAIVNFGVDRSLEFVPHLVWHNGKRKWNEPWRRPQQLSQVVGLERVKLIVDGDLVIEVECRPTPHVTRLDAGFHQRQLARAWEAGQDYLDQLPDVYPYPRLAEIVRSGSALLPLLRRGRVPVGRWGRLETPPRPIVRLFPGRIGGMYPQ